MEKIVFFDWALGIGHWASAYPGHWALEIGFPRALGRVVRNRVFWENTLLWRADWEKNPVSLVLMRHKCF
ncbi:MAG: hypothetical protein EAZ90_04390 [Oscillatoriales cyanobacterium]|nr:MAG: hypothetical protein EAZ90_04390 [Oscillatoriales cyanobacterium]TAE64389.1 MAG: hypothetical protein EAZ86_26950 [Oscillatoriales cyanobacterium]TAG47100.1 MAG: hypothetical protein EAZ33_05330 [Oscillatoriales cyanobacterium]TAH24279.1 MAG: hypothetical protein EAZ10_12015 [Oscillatoriales cyanobacterium]